jgi:hypothetical protein
VIKATHVKYGVLCGLVALASSAHAAGLCKPNETTVFSCDIKESKKTVSICTSPDLSQNRGHIQYRYGIPNKIDLEFPKDPQNSQSQFGYDEYSRPDLSTFVVGFNNGGYRYEISETTEGGDEGVTTRSLLVSSDKKKRGTKLTCLDNANAVSSISTLDQILKCDKDHEIVDGSCD